MYGMTNAMTTGNGMLCSKRQLNGIQKQSSEARRACAHNDLEGFADRKAKLLGQQ